jgi:outer membrane protein OmpA-like peptidoglycan-associated protein
VNTILSIRLLCGLVSLLTWCPGYAESNHQFVPDWDAQWSHQERNSVCALVLPLAEYGEARFVASVSMAPVFELQAHQDLHEPGPISVSKFAPQWHPAQPAREDLGVISHIQGGGGVAGGALAADMLLALREGMHIKLAAPASFNKRVDVALFLTAKDLRPALDEFLRCAQTGVKVAWQEMSRTRVMYAAGAHQLDELGKSKLQALARFVLADPGIKTLYIDGHTDTSGTKKHNLRLAKHRADEVAAYLRECGLTKQHVLVRYHGAAYPIADNDTAQGKADNRRTTIRLERSEAGALAQK